MIESERERQRDRDIKRKTDRRRQRKRDRETDKDIDRQTEKEKKRDPNAIGMTTNRSDAYSIIKPFAVEKSNLVFQEVHWALNGRVGTKGNILLFLDEIHQEQHSNV